MKLIQNILNLDNLITSLLWFLWYRINKIMIISSFNLWRGWNLWELALLLSVIRNIWRLLHLPNKWVLLWLISLQSDSLDMTSIRLSMVSSVALAKKLFVSVLIKISMCLHWKTKINSIVSTNILMFFLRLIVYRNKH